MSTLRELSTELRQINDLANDPEVPSEALADTIEGLEGMFEEKALRVVRVMVNNDSDIAALDAEIKRLQDRKKVMSNAKTRLKDYLRFNMESTGINKIKSPLFSITLGKPRDIVLIEDESLLPEDYKRITIAPDKVLIKKALKDGCDVPGAIMSKGQSSISIS